MNNITTALTGPQHYREAERLLRIASDTYGPATPTSLPPRRCTRRWLLRGRLWPPTTNGTSRTSTTTSLTVVRNEHRMDRSHPS